MKIGPSTRRLTKRLRAGAAEFRLDVKGQDLGPGFLVSAEAFARGESLGDTSNTLVTLPFGLNQVDGALSSMTRSAAQVSRAPSRSDTLDELREIGATLYERVLTGMAGKLLEVAQAAADPAPVTVRIRIHVPGLALLPWEYLFHPVHQDFVALSTRTPLVREAVTKEAPERRPPAGWPLEVRAVQASGLKAWRTGLRTLEGAASAGLDRVAVELVEAPSPDALLGILAEVRTEARVVHIVGEGLEIPTLSSRDAPRSVTKMAPRHLAGGWTWTDEGLPRTQALAMGSDPSSFRGGAEPVPTSSLVGQLAGEDGPRLVVLAGSRTDLVAAELARAVPYVIGFRGEVTDSALVAFGSALYGALLDGRPVAAAVTEGRRAVDRADPGTREWGLPVLYAASGHGPIVAAEDEAEEAEEEVAVEEPADEQEARPRPTGELPGEWGRRLAEKNLELLLARRERLGDAAPPNLDDRIGDLEQRIAGEDETGA